MHTGLGGLTANDTLSALRDVIDAAERMHIPVPVVERGIVELATMFTAGHERWAVAVEDWLSRHQPPGPSLMDVVEVRGAERLARLVGGPSPTDPKAVALLLERWSVVNPKPFADGIFGRVHTRTTATFLEWAIQRVHSAGFEALAASDPKAARRFAEAFIAHANREIHRYRTSGGGGGIGAAMRASLVRSWNALKKDVLGQELVESARDGA